MGEEPHVELFALGRCVQAAPVEEPLSAPVVTLLDPLPAVLHRAEDVELEHFHRLQQAVAVLGDEGTENARAGGRTIPHRDQRPRVHERGVAAHVLGGDAEPHLDLRSRLIAELGEHPVAEPGRPFAVRGEELRVVREEDEPGFPFDGALGGGGRGGGGEQQEQDGQVSHGWKLMRECHPERSEGSTRTRAVLADRVRPSPARSLALLGMTL